MELEKIKELNVKILEKASNNVEKALVTETWDCECFDTMSDAIQNIYKINKMEKYSEDRRAQMNECAPISTFRMMENKDTTDFEKCVSDIIEKHGIENGMIAIMKVLTELMEEDLRIIHNRMYENTMRKLKELK